MATRSRLLSLLICSWAALGSALSGGQFRFGELVLEAGEGYVVDRVAAPPLVERPICADFDHQGRLYVADSSGSNEKVEVQLEKKPHRILRLEDTDADGEFDKSVVFADGMMFPEGVLWHDGAVYCAAPPVIWKLEDTDGDGVADRRTEWFDGKTLTGCANDLHGPYLGPDGFLYWCKGAFAKQEHAIEGRRPVSDKAAHIFRMRPDGTGFDDVLAGGMDNPVEIAWSARGDLFFTTTFINHPANGKRDALVHGLYGGVYPKVHGVLDPLIRTGDFLTPMTHLGPAAPCGLMRSRSADLSEEAAGTLLSCQFNMHKVARHDLVENGASYTTGDRDFLSADNADFHPTDVLEDADGSVLVVDTGGWYKLCCPTSQIAKPEVLGGIYRVRKRDAPAVASPRGEDLDWEDVGAKVLATRLGDPRFVVRDRAVAALAKWGQPGVAPLVEILRSHPNSHARLTAVWALCRIRDESARPAIEGALADRDGDVVAAALHALGVRRDPETSLDRILAVLKGSRGHRLRVAATTLAHLRRREAVGALLESAAELSDRHEEHAIIYALIEIGDAASIRTGLASESLETRRAAMIALDALPGGVDEVTLQAALAEGVEKVTPAALWIYERHPERGGELAGYFRKRIAEPGLSASELEDLQDRLVRFARAQLVAAVMAEALSAKGTAPRARRLILAAMASSTASQPTPKAWPEVIETHLGGADLSTVAVAVRAAKAAQSDAFFDDALLKIARDPGCGRALRNAALVALYQPLETPDAELFAHMMANMDGTMAPVIGRAKLSDAQLGTVRRALAEAGPLELPHLLNPFKRSGSQQLGTQLLKTLSQAQSKRALSSELIAEVFAGYPGEIVTGAAALAASLDQSMAEKEAQLDALEASLPAGDRDRGHLVFNSAKAACLSCHKMAYRGGELGPGLERIGSIRSARDLLEAIVYPSASFVRSFEPVTVTTGAGARMVGIVRDQTLDTISLAVGPAPPMLLSRSDIHSIEPAELSLMPAGLDAQLSKQELADLIAFLQSRR